jgi:hypothetical protein
MFIESLAISVVYFIIKFIEMRFVSGETLPVKILIQNVLSVYAAGIIGLYTIKQFNQQGLKGKHLGGGAGGGEQHDTPVFMADPGF